MSTTISAIAGQTQAAFAATVDGKPGVFVTQGSSAKQVVTVQATNSVVAAYLAPDGTRLAYTVSDAALENLSLRLVNLADGTDRELLRANGGELLSNFAWKPDGSALAYLRTVPGPDDSQPYTCQIWSVPSGGGNPAQVYGNDVLHLLGWGPNGTQIYFTRRVDGLFSFSIKDMGGGNPRDVLLPDSFGGQTDLNILGLAYAQANGQGRLAYALNGSPYLQDNSSTPVFIVDAASGNTLAQFQSQGAATNFRFSPDLSRLAYTALTFPNAEASGPNQPTSAVQIYQQGGGVSQVLPAQAGSGQYTVLGWAGDGSGLFVSGGDGSVNFVKFGGSSTTLVPGSLINAGLSVGGDSGASVFSVSGVQVNLDVPYIQQLKMVPSNFDGNWACGPAAASMIAGYYKKLTPRSDTFQGNFTQYGWYISNVFDSPATGYTFNRYERDPKGRPTPGAYGHIVQGTLAYAWRLTDYFTRLGLNPTFRANVSSNLVKNYLSAGKPVLLSTTIKGFGHIVVAKGYTTDGRIIVNDPYWGKPGAGEIVYAWWQFGSTPWMITIEDAPPAPGTTAPPLDQHQPNIITTVPDVGAGNPSLSDRFKAAASRNGGENNIGKPSTPVVKVNNRWQQNFQGGPRGEGIIVVDDRFDHTDDQPVPTLQPAFAVFGPFLKTWQGTYGGSGGALGAPLSDEFFNLGNNRQQNFEGGYILMQGASDTAQGAYPWPSGFNGWKAEYYNNTGLAGSPAFRRDEPPGANGGFSYNYGNGAPEGGRVGIFADNFSIRFSRAIDFGPGGNYNFTVTSDDGFRLLVDGQNLAGSNGNLYWVLKSATPQTFQVNMGGGVHTIVLEYFEAGSSASVALDISQQVLG